jgi:hypothetical protein
VATLFATYIAACGDSGSASGIDQFSGKTDSPLLEFGEEGSASESKQANETVSAFLAARAKGEWRAACAQLSKALVEKLEKLATNSTGLSDTSCASFLETFVRLTPAQKSETSTEDGSLRQQGARGDLVYFGAKEAVNAMPLEAEGDGWRVAAIAARELG